MYFLVFLYQNIIPLVYRIQNLSKYQSVLSFVVPSAQSITAFGCINAFLSGMNALFHRLSQSQPLVASMHFSPVWMPSFLGSINHSLWLYQCVSFRYECPPFSAQSITAFDCINAFLSGMNALLSLVFVELPLSYRIIIPIFQMWWFLLVQIVPFLFLTFPFQKLSVLMKTHMPKQVCFHIFILESCFTCFIEKDLYLTALFEKYNINM